MPSIDFGPLNACRALRGLREIRERRAYGAGVGISLGFSAAAVTLVEMLAFACFIQRAAVPNLAAGLPFPGFSALSIGGGAFLAALAGACIGLAAARNSLQATCQRHLDRKERELAHDLQISLFDRLLRLDHRYFDRAHPSARFLLLQACAQAARLPSILLGLSQHLMLQAGFLALVFSLQPRIGVFAAVAGPFYFFLSSRIDHQASRVKKLQRRCGNQLIAQIKNSLGKLALVKSYARESREAASFGRLIARQLRLGRRHRAIKRKYLPVDTLLSTGILISVGLLSARKAGIADPTALARSAIALLLIKKIELGARSLANGVREARSSLDATSELLGFFAREMPSVLSEGTQPLGGPVTSIETRALDFAYDNLAPVLRGLDLHIGPGETLAIHGETGSGKSTLARLLLRMYEAPAGSIFVNGRDVRSVPLAQLRQSFFMVTQESRLLPGSFRDNFDAVARGPFSESDMWKILDSLGLATRVKELPTGLDTPLGLAGTKLSGGETQRVAIALGLLAAADVLVIDEAMTGLDEATETKVVAAVLAARRGKITLFITHRKSIRESVDRVLEIADGALRPSPEGAQEADRRIRA